MKMAKIRGFLIIRKMKQQMCGEGYPVKMQNRVNARLYDVNNPLVAKVVEKLKTYFPSDARSSIPLGYVLSFSVAGEPIYFAYWKHSDLPYLLDRLQTRMINAMKYAYLLFFRDVVHCILYDDARPIIAAAIVNFNPSMYCLLAPEEEGE